MQGRVWRLAFAGALTVVMAGVLWWWLVPRPEVAALALPHGEAYIWRPLSGRSVLFVRAAGLERSHNAETVASALRWRGVNRLHAAVWLDGGSTNITAVGRAAVPATESRTEPSAPLGADPPTPELLPDTPAPAIAPGAALPPYSDVAWLTCGGVTYGARCGLGHRETWIIWDVPAVFHEDAGLNVLPAAVFSEAPACLVMTLGIWERLPAATRAVLSTAERTRIVTLDAYGKAADEPQVQACATELDIRPQRDGSVAAVAYASGGP